jgi:hypothetical protein
MTVRFDNSAFVAAHGKNPSGFGRWAFGLNRNTDALAAFFANGTLTQAKAQARAHFAQLGQTVVVFVLS